MRSIALAAALLAGIPAAAAEDEKAWEFYASVYAYDVPEDDYLQPTVTADRGDLHLELRYNYEDASTTSFWAGYNFAFGEKVTFEGTAMLGAAYGATDGVAPGYKFSLGWSKLELYSEGEYLFDASGHSNDYFYAWSELTWSPTEWLRFGLVGQRTRVYATEREIQRGLLLGFSTERFDFSVYGFNADDDVATWVGALGVSF